MKTIYLDNNATTQPAPEVVEAMNTALCDLWANPSSVHRAGQKVRQKLELARETTAKLLGCSDREIIFTGGGTEAANLALRSALCAQPTKSVLLTSRTEHSCVRQTAQILSKNKQAEVVWLKTDIHGMLDIDMLADTLKGRADEIALVAVMWANNETGVIQPIEQIGNLCREHGVRFFVDGVQWVGKMPTNLLKMPIDLLGFSAHKFHGPKGVGGLFVKRGLRLDPIISGGGQEREWRAGTENMPGILGMAAAARLSKEWLDSDGMAKQEALRNHFESTILEQIEDTSVNSRGAARVWNTASIAFHRVEAEAILFLLSEKGICASAGSACASGSLDPSPVLLAMGIPPEQAHGSIRFSMCRETTKEDITQVCEAMPEVIDRLRRSMTPV